jgi:hypothetical protein
MKPSLFLISFAFLVTFASVVVAAEPAKGPAMPVSDAKTGGKASDAPPPFGALKDLRTYEVVLKNRNPFSKMETENTTGRSQGGDVGEQVKLANDPMRTITDQKEAFDASLESRLAGVSEGFWISLGDIFWRQGTTLPPEEIGLQGVEVTLVEITATKLTFKFTDTANGKTGELQYSLRRFSSFKDKPRKK